MLCPEGNTVVKETTPIHKSLKLFLGVRNGYLSFIPEHFTFTSTFEGTEFQVQEAVTSPAVYRIKSRLDGEMEVTVSGNEAPTKSLDLRRRNWRKNKFE